MQPGVQVSQVVALRAAGQNAEWHMQRPECCTTAHIRLTAAYLPDRVPLENPGPLELQEKRVLVVFVETTDPLENKESADRQDHPAAQETKETLEKTGQRWADVIVELQLNHKFRFLNLAYCMKSVSVAATLVKVTIFELMKPYCCVAVVIKLRYDEKKDKLN